MLERLAAQVEEGLRRVNLEYDNKRSTLRLGAINPCRVIDGSWAQLQTRRLERSGGTVEQYKQPHLMSDLKSIEAFELVPSNGAVPAQ
jgi:hypothetical protein